MTSPNEADYITELIWTPVKMETVHAAVQLGIFVMLDKSGTGLTIDNISEKIGAPNKDKVERLLNALVCLKLIIKSQDITKTETCVYKNTNQTSKYLTSRPGSLAAVPVWNGTLKDKGVQHIICTILGKQIEKGAKADESIASLFGNNDAIRADQFQDFMDSFAYPATDFLSKFDLSKHTSAVDLGGSSGLWAGALAKMYPKMDVKVIDREGVIASMEKHAHKLGHGHLITFEAGDFFKAGLPKADIYLLGHIIHDWQDDKALTILRNVYHALSEGGQIILMEKVLNQDKAGPLPAVMLDMHMIHLGLERNFKEYSCLLASCGFVKIHFMENEGYNYYDFVVAEKK